MTAPKVEKDDFYAQFPRSNDEHFHSTAHDRPEWWESYAGVPEDEIGPRVHYARGGTAKAHPASIIPGVHIVGHNPIFHGDE